MTLSPRQGSGQIDHDDDAPDETYTGRCSGPSSAPRSGSCSVHVNSPPFHDHPFFDMTAVNFVDDDPIFHIIMPLGILRLGKKPSQFMLVKNVSGDAKKYIILFDARHEYLRGNDFDIDCAEIIPPLERKAYIRKGEEQFTAMEVDFEGINEDGHVTFIETEIHRQDYHVAPLALEDGDLIRSGDLPTVEGHAVWLSGRWSCPPAEEASSEDESEDDSWDDE
ncbi:hypothetical protein B0A48_18435 [Cryoendolithus antarcticus]|uniref:Uncharacterized protein n=1 Tax=Cryoendolithus antarcticus TaxID=1507870 RepID=A0A1V8S922_9PEZI|nr:hypothetical protein B0A48_18435 [Cryoendolithus antarcticus]